MESCVNGTIITTKVDIGVGKALIGAFWTGGW